MKVTYQLQTPVPSNAKVVKNINGIDWNKIGEIDFVPPKGTMIDTGDGEFREVLEVYFSVESGELEIFFSDNSILEYDFWTNGGWHTNDITRVVRSKKVMP